MVLEWSCYNSLPDNWDRSNLPVCEHSLLKLGQSQFLGLMATLSWKESHQAPLPHLLLVMITPMLASLKEELLGEDGWKWHNGVNVGVHGLQPPLKTQKSAIIWLSDALIKFWPGLYI